MRGPTKRRLCKAEEVVASGPTRRSGSFVSIRSLDRTAFPEGIAVNDDSVRTRAKVKVAQKSLLYCVGLTLFQVLLI